ncbi:MAG: CoA transferase [Pseudomonadales bacterium]|jgi:crotonobetainyl-CoA:carnitine CoA-transferase CaiB-like acyl-CoA transferase|nr:CoA transferase [Pseudomonadales bacterium]MDP6470264.1 CoA transferase [Pseudomonadales bacterium]MDP6827170.1 CoA transferase [Pseudomonadales bacterium]MDP6972399.1 CoA transferase [Pseudomonadales bacterium]
MDHASGKTGGKNSNTEPSGGALSAIRVVDLTDERAIYGAKLLADLGADVVRPEPPGGDPLRNRGPYHEHSDQPSTSLWHAFFASNRRFVGVDPHNATDLAGLEELIDQSDLVLTCRGGFCLDHLDLEGARARRPELIVVNCSSFGTNGPWRDYLAPDLVAGALAGAAATTGDVDTPPLKGFGELNFMVSGVYVAIAALAALCNRRVRGFSQQVGVPVHECIASCLEQVFMLYWYAEAMGRPNDKMLPRRGALHWSNAYDVMHARGGDIMITPAPDFDAQLVWLIEEDAHEDLADPKYLEPENMSLRIERTMDVLRRWAATKDVEKLFFDAQQRHVPYGWVLPIEKVADNPQLEARDWFVPYRVNEAEIRSPGAPYHFSRTPWSLHAYPGEAAGPITDIGWEDRPTTTAAGGPVQPSQRPLEGLRILDFTHVLAGPFATRVLGDMGADVVKVNSADRAIGTHGTEHPYYLMWNRNKRSLALDMTHPESHSICRQLCENADVVIDNFSVGVLERWGVGYEQISATRPGVIYVQMSGMGDGGPWSGFVTYAPTVHALAGLTHLTGVEGRDNIGLGFSYNDHQAGLHGAVAILAALEARHRTGRGQRVDISQFEVGVNFAGPALLDLFANACAVRPTGNRLPYDLAAPHGCYRCEPEVARTVADERWVAIACMSDEQWRNLKHVLGDPPWAANAELDTSAGRVRAMAEIDEQIARWTSHKDAYTVMDICQRAGVPAGVVQTGIDLMEQDPQLAVSRFARPIDDVSPAINQAWADRLPIDFERTPCNSYRRTRELGEDNAIVLQQWLNMDEAAVLDAEARGLLK